METGIHFLGWDKPFSIRFAEFLKDEAAGNRELDGWMIWVPSSRAGRHILNELFTGETGKEEAFHPPRFVTPAQFENTLPGTGSTAGPAQRLMAWKSVIYRARQEDISALFPVLPTQQKHQWAFSLGDQLMRIRSRLLEDGHDFSSVAAGPLENDRDRWAALAELEKAYLAELQASGLSDPDTGFQARLKTALNLMPYNRLLVAGVLNLSRRQISCMEALSQAGVQVDLYLPMPEEFSTAIDAWGRPLAGKWDKEDIANTLLEGRLQRAAEPRELVDRVLELADVYRDQVDALVLGAPDSEMGKYIVERSRLTGTPSYMPEGKALSSTAWGRLIRLVAQNQGGGSFHALLELLRNSLFRKWIRRWGCPLQVVEEAILTLLKERMIHETGQLTDSTLGPIREVGVVREFLRMAEPVLGGVQSGTAFPEWIWQILQTVATDAELSDEAGAVLGQLEEILQDLQADFDPRKVSEQDYWEILGYLLETNHYYPEREAEERPVSGWLELPWERAPHLVILGLPDRIVPGNDRTDAFLTPALCRQLGLYGPDEAAAFHACRLRLILESRREWGKLDLLLPDRGLDDDPELPARFLFLATEEEILERVELLLSERPAPENSIPSHFGALINLPPQPPLERIRVTDFSAYLNSPLHYFMERVLGWAPPRALPVELDPMRFGTLAHRVLEHLNGTDEGARLTSEPDISSFIDDQLSLILGREFGTRLSVPVQIQANGIRERLQAAALVISGERLAGWKPLKVEWKFHKEVGISVEGIPLTGMIDLVERNEETGLYRVVDYKTSDNPVEAKNAHLMIPNANSADPLFPECDFMEGGKSWRWKDLQLMLYHHAVVRAIGEHPEVAYMNLAKAVKQVKLSTWMPTPAQAEAALACAEAVVRQIRQGVIPVEKTTRYKDDWLPWFGGDYATGIHPEWQTRHMEAVP